MVVAWLAAEEEKTVVSRSIGVVLLLSSAVTGVMAFGLLGMYQASVAYYHVAVAYPALYVGILNAVACALCFAGGAAALKRKLFPLTVAGVVFLLASGVAAPVAWGLDNYVWLNGLFVGVFQMAVSLMVLASLIYRKAKRV